MVILMIYHFDDTRTYHLTIVRYYMNLIIIRMLKMLNFVNLSLSKLLSGIFPIQRYFI